MSIASRASATTASARKIHPIEVSMLHIILNCGVWQPVVVVGKFRTALLPFEQVVDIVRRS